MIKAALRGWDCAQQNKRTQKHIQYAEINILITAMLMKEVVMSTLSLRNGRLDH